MKERGKLSYLLVCLLLVLLIYPFADKSMLAGKLLTFFFTLVLISGTFAASSYKRMKFVISLLLAVPASILIWADEFVGNTLIDISAYLSITIFSFFTVFCIVSGIMSVKKVTKDILAGAASAYLLLGISWGLLYSLLEDMNPGSFAASSALGAAALKKWATFNYFSFTTLTTLGYGDITAVTTRAQSLAVLEAVTGVLFVALLISRLVGMYLYQIREENR